MVPPPSYHATLLKMVRYLDGVDHSKGTIISEEWMRGVKGAYTTHTSIILIRKCYFLSSYIGILYTKILLIKVQ